MLPRLLRGMLYAIALGLTGACSLVRPHLERPEVTVVSIDMRRGNLLQQDFAVKLRVQNPNDRELPVRAIQAQLLVEGDAVASGESDHPFLVPAFGSTEFSMTISANLLRAAGKLAGKMNGNAEAIGYELTGVASVDLPFVSRLPFHQAGSFPLRGG